MDFVVTLKVLQRQIGVNYVVASGRHHALLVRLHAMDNHAAVKVSE